MTTTIHEVQAVLLSMIHRDTILVGHSLESDLKATKVPGTNNLYLLSYKVMILVWVCLNKALPDSQLLLDRLTPNQAYGREVWFDDNTGLGNMT